jgi:SPP1 family predicted phage head-tail adaptor
MVRNKITIKRYTTTQDGTGSLVKSVGATYTKWAEARNRTGAVGTDQWQREWSYDYSFKVRYTTDFIEQSGDVVTFNGSELAIREVVFEDEGNKRFVILRCSKVDG